MIRLQPNAPALAAICASLSLAACAHGAKPEVAESLPTERPVDGRAQLYADCASQAGPAKTITRFGHYLRFTCTGAPAKALYDAAEIYVRLRGREVITGSRTTRHISSTLWDDQCWSDRDPSTGERTYACFTDQPMKADFVDGIDVPPPADKPKKK